MTDAVTLLGLLAAPDRLRVVAALALGANRVEDVADVTGLTSREVLRAIARLEAHGLVTNDGGPWRLHPELFAEVARAAAPADEPVDFGSGDRQQESVLRTFVREGRITSFPAAASKRRMVLDHVVRVFEVGVRYPEAEVNAILRAFHTDTAALRRYLVDEGLLTREAGLYWRTGGPVEV